MRCDACDEPAPERSRFCPYCGRPLVDIDATRLAAAGADATVLSAASVVSVGPAAAPLALASGVVLADRYRIVRPLGRGGMGVVYQADDLRLGHPVALKFLPEALAADATRLAQFHNEVRVARQVSHPNVCRVYDIGDVDGHLFLSMEYVEGLDLAARIAARGVFSEADAVDVIRSICAGLAAVHARGVLHRDLKPANIMIAAGGRPKLMDFGIAAAAGDARGERGSEIDACVTTRRMYQVAVQGGATPLTMAGIGLIVRGGTASAVAGALLLLTIAVLIAIELRYPLEFAAVYKGHAIRFRNHPVFGERLYIDDELVDRGRFGSSVTLRGTIERGAGAGERITAQIRLSYSLLACRVVAEAFAAEA